MIVINVDYDFIQDIVYISMKGHNEQMIEPNTLCNIVSTLDFMSKIYIRERCQDFLQDCECAEEFIEMQKRTELYTYKVIANTNETFMVLPYCDVFAKALLSAFKELKLNKKYKNRIKLNFREVELDEKTNCETNEF